jgi:hypothetical protein
LGANDVQTFIVALQHFSKRNDTMKSLLIPQDDDADFESKLEALFPSCVSAAVDRLRAVNDARDAAYEARQEKLRTLTSKRSELRHDVDRAERHIQAGDTYTDEDLAAIAKTKARTAKLAGEIASLRGEKSPPCLPLETITDWIGEQTSTFEAVPVDIKLQKGESPLDALAASRRHIDDLRSDLITVHNALVPEEEAVAGMVEDVEAVASQGAPDFSACAQFVRTSIAVNAVKRQGHVEFSRELIDTGAQLIEIGNGSGLAVWALKDQIIARGRAEIARLYEGQTALSVPERNRRAAEIEAEILKEERREEAILRRCEDAGLAVFRRPFANPLAILGIAPLKGR